MDERGGPTEINTFLDRSQSPLLTYILRSCILQLCTTLSAGHMMKKCTYSASEQLLYSWKLVSTRVIVIGTMKSSKLLLTPIKLCNYKTVALMCNIYVDGIFVHTQISCTIICQNQCIYVCNHSIFIQYLGSTQLLFTRHKNYYLIPGFFAHFVLC